MVHASAVQLTVVATSTEGIIATMGPIRHELRDARDRAERVGRRQAHEPDGHADHDADERHLDKLAQDPEPQRAGEIDDGFVGALAMGLRKQKAQAFAIKRRIGGDEGADDDGDHHGGQESRADPEHPLLSRLNTKM